MHCHAFRSKSFLAGLLSAASCFTVKASEPEPKLDLGNAAGHKPKQNALIVPMLAGQPLHLCWVARWLCPCLCKDFLSQASPRWEGSEWSSLDHDYTRNKMVSI